MNQNVKLIDGGFPGWESYCFTQVNQKPHIQSERKTKSQKKYNHHQLCQAYRNETKWEEKKNES